MDDLDREFNRAARNRRKQRSPGIHNEVCVGCGCDIAKGRLEEDHIAGRKSDDRVWPLCPSCHRKRTEMQQDDEPLPSQNPRNVFEVIGRWLLAMAEYFELLRDTLWRFGVFLIDLARQGYGAELKFP
jgi:hypothetical protein